MCEGIGDELLGIDLGDKRLDKRSKKLIAGLAADPQASVNGSFDSWRETFAAYRFFDNQAVEPEKILAPHVAATKRRMAEHPVVLHVQDTTEFEFDDHPPQDARCLHSETHVGFYDHTYLAVTPERLCLGVLGGEQFDRSPESLGKAAERKKQKLPLEQKESFRWLTGFRQASELAKEFPNQQIVSVADREADIYDIFLEAELPESAADFIIRAKEDRSTPERDLEAGPRAYCKVKSQIASAPVLTTRIIQLPQTPQRAARQATLLIRAQSFTVRPPTARPHLPPVTYNVVFVDEVDPPTDGTAVSWLLLTTLSIATVAEVLLVIDYYVARWIVEVYFRTLKTGCQVEKMQLETLHRVKNCLAFYKIIAWRILHLTYLNRECPSLPCTAVFQDCEWKSVWKVTKRAALPKQPPLLSEFMSLVAQLGGYNARAQDPSPGPQVIWTGLRRMHDFALAWTAFNEQGSCV